jgi:energy-coupling factor transport system permease protein
MENKLTFFEPKDSPLHRLTPFTKLMGVFTLIFMTFISPFYYLPTGLLFLVILPIALWGRIGRSFGQLFLRILLPVIGFLFVMQSFFAPGGHTILFTIWFLTVTREGVIFAYLISTRVAVMVSAFIVFLLSAHPSDLMTDLCNRGVPSMLSYVITTSLQIIPQMRIKAQSIIDAQHSRGLETEGRLKNRILALVPLVRPLVLGSLVDVEERTIAVEARGFASPDKKTHIKQIRDTTTDRVIRWFFLVLILLTIGSRLWR